jgi:hypothetical protein
MRLRHAITAVAVVAIVAALVAFASMPTGAATRDAVVPADARVAATGAVGDARVLLLSQRGRLRLLVAYHRSKGWFGVPVAPAPQGSPVAWAATRGSSVVPSLSAVYGRTDGSPVGVQLRVRWADERQTLATPASDGAYLVVRRGRVRVADVSVVAADGSATSLGAP